MHDHFVIVGAQRCGTSYLYHLLDEHPEIEMAKPPRPEPKFFLDDDRYPLGIDYYESAFFSEPGTRVRGEKSTSYIESDVAVQRINATLPGADVVVVLRDPVRRAISNYRFSTAHGNEDVPIDEALRASASDERAWDPTRFSVSPYAYVARSRYIDYLERLASSVERDRIHVVMFEELVADLGVVAGLYERLGVDATFRPRGFGAAVNASNAAGESVAPELLMWLRELFRESNGRLEEFLGRPLPWPA
jgi:hypothetical protein